MDRFLKNLTWISSEVNISGWSNTVSCNFLILPRKIAHLLKLLLLYYVWQEIFECKEGAASSDDICIIVINVLELRKAKLSTVFSKLLLKSKAAINTVLPLAYALLRKTFKENALGYLLLTQRNMSKSKGHDSATRYVVVVT